MLKKQQYLSQNKQQTNEQDDKTTLAALTFNLSKDKNNHVGLPLQVHAMPFLVLSSIQEGQVTAKLKQVITPSVLIFSQNL